MFSACLVDCNHTQLELSSLTEGLGQVDGGDRGYRKPLMGTSESVTISKRSISLSGRLDRAVMASPAAGRRHGFFIDRGRRSIFDDDLTVAHHCVRR